ncbi:hypothetical protein JXL19_01370 [bacterium]|nr:hypothetical protein [bacterium]
MSRFLAFSNRNEDLSPDLKTLSFIERLSKDDTVADWQAQQAETPI